KEKITPDQAQQPETKARLQKEAREKTARLFPILYRHLITQQHLNIKMLLENDNPTLRTQLAKEIINLIKHITGVKSASIKKTKESLLKERIQLIQEYVNLKFPAAELYLFPFSEIDMKKGRFSSTLESKESSGSAYELILNYDTLMPGIYFTPVIPAHFIFHQDINNAPKTYGEIIDYIRFDLLNRIYGDLKHRMMDQGPTPDLDVDYVARHNGALYWEAFKATSGNLPKALLNLFRYESFLEEDTGKTVIQLIKNPGLLDDYIAGNPETDEIPVNSPFLPSWKLPDFELAFPELAFDPWWMRYKALKISYNEQANVSEIKKDELTEISAIIDLAFALHVRLSDVFTKPGSVKKMDSHREKVLSDFLKFAFPPDSARRKQLENIFVGEISEVNHFEETMRDLFKKLIQRVKKKIEQRLEGEVEKKEEFDIWYHYYQEHFEPKENTIKRTILKHLMVPRGRLQIGLMGKSGWFFKSLQKASGMGKRFDTFDILDQLPDQAVLFENTGFLSGLAHCIFNGYYGILDEGTLKERYTSLELDGKHMDLGNQSDNQFAFINPAQVEKMMLQILRLFPQKKVDHRDCLYEVRKIKELFIFINLLNFGKVSFLYRDNLNTVFFDEIENPSLHERAKQFNRSYFDFFHAPELHKTLSYFIQNQKIDLRDIKLKIWVNTNSFETNHVASNVAKKEDELQNEFFDCFLENHLKKQAAQTPPKGLPEIFDKQSLKLTLLCGIMLINFGSDAEKKYTVCRNLLHQSWKEDYGDPEAFYKRVLMDYDRFFISRADEYKRIDSFIQDLNFGLTSFQKEKFLGMIEEIIHADKKPIQKKLDLYKRIKQQISYF
ncbi:MAG: hypothetical protein OEY59_13350, partial [Deltaproteobacteria bacterium]|nr:hypothetical protein [Deltaproteobacteria bacterium]